MCKLVDGSPYILRSGCRTWMKRAIALCRVCKMEPPSGTSSPELVSDCDRGCVRSNRIKRTSCYVNGHLPHRAYSHKSWETTLNYHPRMDLPTKLRSPTRPDTSQYASFNDSFTICICSRFRKNLFFSLRHAAIACWTFASAHHINNADSCWKRPASYQCLIMA